MEAVEVKLEDILSCEEIPIVRLKSYVINAFVMRYHVIRKIGPFHRRWVTRFHELTNKLDKYVVVVKGKDGDIIGHLALVKSGKFAKTVFYILNSDKNHNCKIAVTGKATNAGDRLGMKVPSFFLTEETFIIILQKKPVFKIYLEITRNVDFTSFSIFLAIPQKLKIHLVNSRAFSLSNVSLIGTFYFVK